MHFYQYTDSTHFQFPILIILHLSSMLFWIRLYLFLHCPWQRAKLFKMSCFQHIWKVNTWLLAVIRFCLPSYFNNIHKLTSKPAPKFLRAQTNCRQKAVNWSGERFLRWPCQPLAVCAVLTGPCRVDSGHRAHLVLIVQTTQNRYL